jgi:hypothetical protein
MSVWERSLGPLGELPPQAATSNPATTAAMKVIRMVIRMIKSPKIILDVALDVLCFSEEGSLLYLVPEKSLNI